MYESNYQKYLAFLKRLLTKIKPRFSFHYVAYTTLFVVIIFSVVQLVSATTPNPGHPWTELGDGVFTFTNGQTVTNYTYTFPAANTTALTTNASVTVAQGGTGLGSIADKTLLVTTGANTLSALVIPAGQSVRRNAGDTAFEAYAPGIGDMVLSSVQTITGAKTFGTIGGAVGKLIIAGSTSGSTILDATPIAGSGTVTLPTTGTLATLAGSEALSNKTYNSLTITANGTNTLNIATGQTLTVTTGGTLGSNAYTSTAYAPLASPTFTTPNIGVASGTSLSATGVLSSGTNGGTGGQLTLNGATSGSGIIKVNAAAGSGIIFQLPSTNGSNTNILSTNGAGVTSWVAATAGGATSWDAIGDPAGDGAIAMGATTQTMDWGTATTQSALTLTAPALTSGILFSLTSSGTAAATNQTGLDVTLTGANAGTATTYASAITNQHTGTSAVDYAGYFTALGSGTTSKNIGLYATASGAATNYAGIFDQGNVGIGTTNPSSKLEIRGATGAGSVSTILAPSVNGSKYGFAENQYGLYNGVASTPYKQLFSFGSEGTYSDAGALSNYDFYIYDSNATAYRMYVNGTGNIGIGLTNPTAVLHLKAGSTTAGTAPLKLTSSSGSLLSTTEGGAVEFDGTHLYFTASDAGPRYQLDQQSGGSSTLQGAYNTTSGNTILMTSSRNVNFTNIAGTQFAVAMNTGVAPTVDMVSISNATGDITGVSGLKINYLGGSASVEGSGSYISLTPGGSASGTWNGQRIAIGATAAVALTENGLKIESGISGAGSTINGLMIANIATGGTGTENAISIGSGWDAGIKMFETNTTNGTNYLTLSAPAAITANMNWTLPDTDFSGGGCLKTNGSGTLSVGACGDVKVDVVTSTSSWSKPANAILLIVEAWGGGGGGAGGAAAATVIYKSGGGAGGGGAYNSATIAASSLGGTVPVTIGAGGTGGTGVANGNGNIGVAGGQTCFSATTACAGVVYLQAFGGGGGGASSGTGAGGGGGGGTHAVGANASTSTGGAGGGPLGAAAGAVNSGSGGAGGGNASTTAVAGGAANFGGGGGGTATTTAAANSGVGGNSIHGGAGGGGGASVPVTTFTQRSGGNGGVTGALTVVGAALGGTTTGQAGAAGANGIGFGGNGGGGGANIGTTGGVGGVGGAGGAEGGGGGGGGAANFSSGTSTGGAGGAGGRGEVRITSIRGSGADLAEIYGTNDETIEAGDIVSIDDSMSAGVRKTDRAYGTSTIGVISTQPGLLIGNIEDVDSRPVMVALSGRVPMKVNLENGPIKKGDYLTASSTPGVAMKATKAGLIIGQSMTEYSDPLFPGFVVAFIKSGPSNGSKLADILPDGLALDATPTSDNSEKTIQESPKQKTLEQRALAYFNENKAVLEESVNISEITTDRLTAGLEIITPSLYASNVYTDNISSSLNDSIVFNSPSEFTVPPLFNKDTAGFALIKQGDKRVRVDFETPYIAEPSVSSSLVFNIEDNITDILANDIFNNKVESIVVDSDKTGFTILLNKNAPRDLRYSWNAFAVRDPKVFESVIEGLTIEAKADIPPPEVTAPSNTTVDNTIPPVIDNILNPNETTPIIVEDKKDEVVDKKSDKTTPPSDSIIPNTEIPLVSPQVEPFPMVETPPVNTSLPSN